MHQGAAGVRACKICQFLVLVTINECTVGSTAVIGMVVDQFVGLGLGLGLALAAGDSIYAVDILAVGFHHRHVFLDEDVVLIP